MSLSCVVPPLAERNDQQGVRHDVSVRFSRSRADVARSLRADLGQPQVDDDFVNRLASVAAAARPLPTPPLRGRLRIAALACGLSTLTVVGGLGVAYGAGFVAPPWSPEPSPSHTAPSDPGSSLESS